MKPIEIFEESVIVLKTNRLRTGLSMLGIIIGIGSVIALMTLGYASQQSVMERIQSLGANLLTVRPGSEQHGFLRGPSEGSTSLTYDDAKAIEESQRFTTINMVAAEYSSQAQISYGSINSNVQISGVTPNFFELRNIDIELGQTITEQDNLLLNNTAVIGSSLAEELFESGENPLGKNIRINGSAFKITGVVESNGTFGSFRDIVYTPLTTAQHTLFGVNHVSSIYAGAIDESVMEEAENQLGFFLMERHRIDKPEDADFSISSQGDILETASEVTQTFTTLLTGIAAISLIVGGIGIMNIMLVTVTERTREIGIRKALGAKRKNITAQFLVESMVLTIIGGLVGVIAGLAVSYAITNLMNLPSVISPTSIIMAFGVSALIGIIFGWYPAQKAAKLQPIDALRYE